MPADDTKPGEKLSEEAQEQADFASGMPDEPAETTPDAAAETAAKPDAPAKPAAKPEPKPAPEPKPEYVQITRKDWDDIRAAAAKTASYDQQFSRVFGTVGNLQKTLTTLQTATPRGAKIEIPKDAFADMERDFPELAQQLRGALEKTLAGVTGTGPANAEIDPEALKRSFTEHAAQLRIDAEVETLNDEHPDWKKIVGHVEVAKGEKPDPNNPFRKWLATKDQAYQEKIGNTLRAAVLMRAIDQFKAETKTPAATPNPKLQQRAGRIADAVQPRGDGGHAGTRRTEEDEFAAGYADG